MAKKEATKFSYGVFDRKHIASIKKRLKAIDALFDAAITEGARIGEASGFKDPDRPFYISDYPAVQEHINDLMRTVGRGLQGVIETGDREEWLLSCEKNNAMVDAITSSTGLPKDVISQWKQPNLEALSAFQQRKEAGMTLSSRVWNITEQFKEGLELALDLGLGDGKSAADLSRDVRKYLNEPNKLFRRVRDKHGALRLSKAARAYHPGQGVYRSSYKNALRLTATENNMAYRMADSERWKQIPFVIGIRVSISHNSHPIYDICDELQGEYPKDFVWLGWHPFCKCAAVAVRAKEEEFLDYQQRILAGEDVSDYKFSGTISCVPDNFKRWVNNNAERIGKATKLPYFIRDNKKMAWFGSTTVSRYDNTYMKMMSESGIRLSENTKEKLPDNPFNRIDIASLNDNIQKAFNKHGVSNLSCSVSAIDKGLMLKWRGQDVLLERRFYIDSDGYKVVDHTHFSIPKELQGKGISKQVFRALYEQYKAAGVQRMEVFANIDVGGYTWARYGFCVKSRNEVIGAIRFSALTKKQEERIMALIDDHFAESSAPFPMNKIARLPFGKKALLGSNWEGVLDLTDPQQRSVFEKYLR